MAAALFGLGGVAGLAYVWSLLPVRPTPLPYARRADVIDLARTVCPSLAEDLVRGDGDG